MDKQDAAPVAHEQPYDSSFKALLDDQTLAVLSFLFGEHIEDAHELKVNDFRSLESVRPGAYC